MLICPQCQQLDAIRKVTYIVMSGTTESMEEFNGVQRGIAVKYQKDAGYSIGTNSRTILGTTHSIASTYLAQKLTPPEKPTPPTDPNKHIWLWFLFPWIPYINSFFIIAVWFAPVTKKKKLYMLGTLGVFPLVAIMLLASLFFLGSSNQYNSAMNIVLIMSYTVSFFAFIAFQVFYYWGLMECKKQRHSEYDEKLKYYTNVTLQTHQAAIERWRSLYHCARCDIVFIPAQPQYVNTGQMKTLLYQ